LLHNRRSEEREERKIFISSYDLSLYVSYNLSLLFLLSSIGREERDVASLRERKKIKISTTPFLILSR